MEQGCLKRELMYCSENPLKKEQMQQNPDLTLSFYLPAVKCVEMISSFLPEEGAICSQ